MVVNIHTKKGIFKVCKELNEVIFIVHLLLYDYHNKIIGGIVMNRNETNKTIWRLLILDVSGVYTQIYDEIYGNNPNTLSELLELYSDEKKYKCLSL